MYHLKVRAGEQEPATFKFKSLDSVFANIKVVLANDGKVLSLVKKS